MDALQRLLAQVAADGIVRADVNFAVLSSMLERIGDLVPDTDFLLDHGLKFSQAFDEALAIIMHGIMSDERQ